MPSLVFTNSTVSILSRQSQSSLVIQIVQWYPIVLINLLGTMAPSTPSIARRKGVRSKHVLNGAMGTLGRQTVLMLLALALALLVSSSVLELVI